MRAASAATIAILNGTAQILRADLYTFTLRDGTVLRFTDADIALIVSGQTYAIGPVITRSRTKQSLGITVDNVTVSIADDGGTIVAGSPLIAQVVNGLFDGATVEIAKLFLSSWTDTSPGAVPWFKGRVSESQCELGEAHLTVNSMTELLNQQMPREIYQPTCNNTVFDNSCGLAIGSYTAAVAVASGFTPTVTKFKHTGTLQADTYYALGKVMFTGGPNAGQKRSVKSYIGGVVELFSPLPFVPALADAVSLVPGCDKVQGTCSTKFNNLPKFKGTPYVPVPETAMGSNATTGAVGSSGATGAGASGSSTTSVRGRGTYVA